MRVGYHVVRASAQLHVGSIEIEKIQSLKSEWHKYSGGAKEIPELSDEIAVGIENGTKLIKEFGLKPCAQIFIGSPMSWGVPEIPHVLAQRLSKHHIVIHSSYVSSPWSGKPGSLYNLKRELQAAARIGASIIVHLSALCADNTVLDTFASYIRKHKINVRIWLETQSAKQRVDASGDATKHTGAFETPEKINAIYAEFRKRSINVGICIDTAHIYACGVSLETYDFTERWLSKLDRMPIMFHLNDTTETLGSGKDVHIALCKGNIWRGYKNKILQSGIAAIVKHAQENESWIILENHTVDPFERNGVSGDLNIISYIVNSM